MKSRIRSRWHRPNEKPLENDALPALVAPMGEIDPNASALTDDLAITNPMTKLDSNKEIPSILMIVETTKESKVTVDQNPNYKRNDHSSRENQTAEEGEAKKSSNHPKRRPRKRNNNHHKKAVIHP